MRNERGWLAGFFSALAGGLGEGAFNSSHRVPRMMKFGARHGSKALRARLARGTQRAQLRARLKREANRLEWSRMPAGLGAPKHWWERKPWKKTRGRQVAA